MVHIGRFTFSWQRLLPLMLIQFIFLLSFQFLAIPFVYSLIAIALVIFAWFKDNASLKESTKTDLGIIGIAILLFTVFLYLSPLYLESSHWLRNILLAISFPAFYMLGYWLIHHLEFKLKTILMVIIIGVSAFVFVNLIYTLFRYLPWYQWLYQGQVIYINGEVYLVSEEVKWLLGLSFVEVKASYMDFYLTLLFMPMIAHLLVWPRSISWREDAWWLLAGGVAILGVILLPTLTPIILALIAYFVWLFLHHYARLEAKYPQVIQSVLVGFFTLIGFLVVLFFVDTYNLFGLAPAIKSFWLLARILDFPLIEGYQSVLRSFPQYLFGGFAPILIQGRYVLSTQSWVFDTLHQAGIFSFVGLLLMAILFFNQLRVFFSNDRVAISLRYTILAMVVMFMFYQSFQTTLYPYVREAVRFQPRLMHDEMLWPLMFLLMGTIMVDPLTGMNKKPQQKNRSMRQRRLSRKRNVRH